MESAAVYKLEQKITHNPLREVLKTMWAASFQLPSLWKCLFPSCISSHLFHQCLLSTYRVPGTVQPPGPPGTIRVPAFLGFLPQREGGKEDHGRPLHGGQVAGRRLPRHSQVRAVGGGGILAASEGGCKDPWEALGKKLPETASELSG